MVDLAGRRVEDGHHFVAGVVDDRSLVLDQARDERGVVAVEQRDDVLRVVTLGIGREPAQVREERGDLDDRATERGLVGIGEQSRDDGRRQVAAEQRVDRAVEAGVLELHRELSGHRRRHRPVAVVEDAVLALEGDDARRFVLHQERPDQRVVALDRRMLLDRVGRQLTHEVGGLPVAHGLEPAVVDQRQRDAIATEAGVELDRGAVEQRVLVVEHRRGAAHLDEPAELARRLAFTLERKGRALEHCLLGFGEVELAATVAVSRVTSRSSGCCSRITATSCSSACS